MKGEGAETEEEAVEPRFSITRPPPQADYQIAIASSDLAFGKDRFAFSILDGAGQLIEAQEVDVNFFELREGESIEREKLEATYFPSVLEGAGLYVVYPNFTYAGVWGAEIAPRSSDSSLPPQRIRFAVAQVPAAPAIGEKPPTFENLTAAIGEDLSQISSDPDPDPRLYSMSLKEGDGKRPAERDPSRDSRLLPNQDLHPRYRRGQGDKRQVWRGD